MSATLTVLAAVGSFLILAALLLVLVVMFAGRQDSYLEEAADPVDEQVIEYQRAKYFTGEEAAGPAIVAGQDLDWADRRGAAQVALEFRLLVDESLGDVNTNADRLADFYLVPEVSG